MILVHMKVKFTVQLGFRKCYAFVNNVSYHLYKLHVLKIRI
jgi:hypothetical protein